MKTFARILTLIVLLVAAAAAEGIDGSLVSPSAGPPPLAYTTLLFYDAGGNMLYLCQARSTNAAAALTVVSVSKSNPAVVTVNGHGLRSGNVVTFAGGAAAWTALNGAHAITVTGVNTFTVAVDTSGFSGNWSGALTTAAPSTTAAIWAIQRFTYNAGGQLTATEWADGSSARALKCDDRATLSYQ